jgi:hypothetical protein
VLESISVRSSVFAALLLGACASGRGEELSSTRGPITNGTVDTGDDAVVVLVDDGGAVVCTAVMLSAHVAVTAAHCGIGATNYRDFRAVVGPDSSGERLELGGARIHPSFDPTSFANDIAVVTIRAEIKAKPITTFAAPEVDGHLRVVGYGRTEGGKLDAGTKRSGLSYVALVDDRTFVLTADPSQPCEGDSGGPAFSGDALVGLTSHGDSACSMPTTDTRIDAHLESFVKPYLAERAAPGKPCTYDGQCQAGTCTAAEDEPTNTFCAVPCDAGCPSNTTCRDGLCRWPLPSPGAPSSSCEKDSDCINAECVGSVCVRRCNPAANDCPSKFHCENTGGIQYQCVADPPEAPVTIEARGSGCATSPSRSSPWWLALVLLGLSRRSARS